MLAFTGAPGRGYRSTFPRQSDTEHGRHRGVQDVAETPLPQCVVGDCARPCHPSDSGRDSLLLPRVSARGLGLAHARPSGPASASTHPRRPALHQAAGRRTPSRCGAAPPSVLGHRRQTSHRRMSAQERRFTATTPARESMGWGPGSSGGPPLRPLGDATSTGPARVAGTCPYIHESCDCVVRRFSTLAKLTTGSEQPGRTV